MRHFTRHHCAAVALAICAASTATMTTAADLNTAPSPLLSIDQNRIAVVDNVVARWGDALVASSDGLTLQQLRTLISGLRADHLLAASLAGNLEGLRNVIANALTSTADVNRSLVQTKALGDAAADLTYTPVVPCRIVDTVQVGGAIQGGTRRSFVATTATNFSAQGGASTNCAIPLNAAAVQAIATVVDPPAQGYMTIYPYNVPQPGALNLVYPPNRITTTAVTIQLTKGQAFEFTTYLEQTTYLQVDVVGFFSAPSGSIGTVTNIATGTGLTGGPITTTGTISVANGGIGTAQLANGAVGTTQIAPNAVTQAKLSPVAGAAAGKVLGTDGTNLLWTDAVGGGTVTSVATGAGLTGGPITTSGTINLAATQLLPTVACSDNQIAKWIGGAWTCQADANAGGTVTSVGTGSGLTGGPITGSGTINLATTQLLPTVACSNNQIPKWNGVAWTCQADANSGGTVTNIATGAGLTGGPISVSGTIDLASTQLLPTVPCATNQIPKWSGVAWTCQNDASSGGTVTSVGASAPLASTGGNTPVISLNGTVAVANGGTGRSTLTTNALLVGQGTGAVGMTVGGSGQVLLSSAGVPTWSNTLDISGNIKLVPSTATAGNILKGTAPFVHNFGTFNTFVGENAGNFSTTGQNNSGQGSSALANNTTGDGNTGNGSGTLYSNLTGSGNTAAGWYSLYNNTTGDDNTASGTQSLFSNTIGVANSALGALSLLGNTSGNNNTAVGIGTLFGNLTGNYNTAVGSDALGSNFTGNYNTAIGTNALLGTTSGIENTGFGHEALSQNTIGSYNIAVGQFAGSNLTDGDYNIAIGHPGVAADAGAIRIGDAAHHTQTFIAGIFGKSVLVASGVPVLVDSTGKLGTVSSSRRYKDDIADMDDASAALMKLRPVTFHYKSDRNPAGRTLQYGLIAEEVAGVFPGLVARSADGRIETVMYQFLAPMLLNEYQKQQRTIEAQKSEITQQATRIAALEQEKDAEVASLHRELAELKRSVDVLLARDQREELTKLVRK